MGDSPLIGCGCYADSELGGVSCTGYGEAIMRRVLEIHGETVVVDTNHRFAGQSLQVEVELVAIVGVGPGAPAC